MNTSSQNVADHTPRGWRAAWLAWRNRVIASPSFQRGAARFLPTRFVARRRAARLFDLVAGFAYSQVLAAVVESGLIALLAGDPRNEAVLGETLALSPEATARLLRAAESLDLAEQVAPGWWTLGEQGAALAGNPGAQAMIRHHRLLYADLADPLALLRDDRAAPTALSRFWSYAAAAEPAAAAETGDYSALMAASQRMVADQVIAAYPLARHRALLDVGGGHGAFVGAVAEAAPTLRLGVFDLPEVVAAARALEPTIETHGGDFFRDPLPEGFDLISLVRILHDHDDAPAEVLLTAVRRALPAGGRLLIAEPMAGTRGARAMGDGYFGLYLWAMRSGRPRRADELGAMLGRAGFARWRERTTPLPLVARIIVAET